MTRITEEEKNQICTLYQEGKSTMEVASIVGRGQGSVCRVLKARNIKMRTKGDHKNPTKYSEDKVKEIIRLYTEENKNTVEIANIFNTYNTTIRRILQRNNIKIRTASEARRFIDLNDIKSKEGTSDFDYFLGLLATDGCITNNRIILDFSKENKELLDYWNEFLGNKCNITCSIHKVFKVPQYRIAFKNKEVADYLGTFGIVPNKTFQLHLKYINWDVLRGIIDGDGCVLHRNNDKTVAIGITSGCKEFLEQIKDFYTSFGINSYLKESSRNKNPTYDLYVYKTSDILIIYEHLYKNAHYFLKRKESKFGSLLKKFNRQSLVNSGKESCASNPEPSLPEEGVETLYETPKSSNTYGEEKVQD